MAKKYKTTDFVTIRGIYFAKDTILTLKDSEAEKYKDKLQQISPSKIETEEREITKITKNKRMNKKDLLTK